MAFTRLFAFVRLLERMRRAIHTRRARNEAGDVRLGSKPMTATIMIMMITTTEKVVGRFGPKTTLVVGLATLAAALVRFARMPVAGPFVSHVLVPSLLGAIGMSLAYIPAMITATAGARPEEVRSRSSRSTVMKRPPPRPGQVRTPQVRRTRHTPGAPRLNEADHHPAQEVVDVLVAGHREFLAFVERRVGDRALAEEILQDALVRSLAHVGEIRESAVGWFYRVLRNTIIDRARRAAVQRARLEALADELEASAEDRELQDVVCHCVGMLADTLKPEYADALRRIDVDGMQVKDYAEQAGISASNAGVRVFRAREALRKQVARSCGTCAAHGCLDCTCGGPGSPAHG